MRTLFLVLPLLTASGAYAKLVPATVYNATSNAPVAITGNCDLFGRDQGLQTLHHGRR